MLSQLSLIASPVIYEVSILRESLPSHSILFCQFPQSNNITLPYL